MLADPPEEPQHPDNVTIASVRRFYTAHHLEATHPNGRPVVRDQRGPRRAFALLVVYMWKVLRDEAIEGAPRVGHFTLAHQHGFMRWCRDRHKHSNKTISTYLSYIKAGFRFAAVPRLIEDARGRRREARLLLSAPFVADSETTVAKETGLPRSRPRDWIPTDAEMAAFLAACRSDNPVTNAQRESVFRYAIVALNTMARPEAITELSVLRQVRFDASLIELNPAERLQTRKVRPTIRLTDNLQGWLTYWNLDRPLCYHGRPVAKVDNRSLKAAAKRAQIPEWRRFTRYTLRHYMATRIRRVAGVSVAREERAEWMGHTDPDHRTTEEWYESLDADYLENVRRAIDGVMIALAAHTPVPLFAPGTVAGTRLTVVQSELPVPPKADAGGTNR